MTVALPITGGCLCKAVRYAIASAPKTARTCWCRVCQYIGAGTACVSVCFASADVSVSGTLTDYVSVADSGNRMHRRFCPVCGTHIFSAAEARPHLIYVRAGSLDDPEIGKPEATIWTASAPTWACIDAGLPQVAGQPPPVA